MKYSILQLSSAVMLCAMLEVAYAVPIIEPNFTKVPGPPFAVGETPAGGICGQGGGGTPNPCKPNVEGKPFRVTDDGTNWPNLTNDLKVGDKPITVWDLHLRITGPADAKWGDVNGDMKIGASDLFPAGGTLSADGKTLTLKGPPGIEPGVAFKPHFKKTDETVEVAATMTVVPEPATLLLVGTTAAGLGLARWRQRRQKQA